MDWNKNTLEPIKLVSNLNQNQMNGLKKKQNSRTESVFVKLEGDSVHEAKKNLLKISESAIRLQLVSKNIGEISKNELRRCNGIKKGVREIITALNKIVEEFVEKLIDICKEELDLVILYTTATERFTSQAVPFHSMTRWRIFR